MFRVLTVFLLLIPGFLLSQINTEALKENLEKEVQDVNINDIAYSLGYRKGDLVRVSTMFTITENGTIDSIIARGPHEAFENEAIKILKKLPQMDPAIINGEPKRVRFALPISFKITKRKKIRKTKN